MELAVTTHFSQGWPLSITAPALSIGARSVRDSVRWNEVERIPGAYDFGAAAVAYPDRLRGEGIDMTMVFHPANPLYDNGETVRTPEGLEAFASFVAAVLHRYPWLRRIEIGNEFNAGNFVSGEVLAAPYADRAGYYARIVAAVDARLAREFPHVEIIGGAMHSVPVGYAGMLVEAGAMDHSDAVAFHPYTSPPEQLAAHIDMLRVAMGPNPLPLHATEFSQEFSRPEEGPGYLVKMSSVMAAADVAVATWYALREQPWFKGTELLDRRGQRLPAADAYAFLSGQILTREGARRLPSDPFTHLYLFGDDVLVAWGEPRNIRLPADVAWYDARGRRLAPGPRRLDRNAPLVAIAPRPISPKRDILLGSQPLLGDSFFQFDPRLAPDGSARSPWSGPMAATSSWTYLMENGEGKIAPLATMPGGEKANESWRPYVGHPYRRPLSVTEEAVVPVDFAQGTRPAARESIVERFTSKVRRLAVICGAWRVSEASGDGVSLRITRNGKEIFARTGKDPVSLRLEGVRLEPGTVLDFVVGPNGDARGGDTTTRAIAIYDAARAPATCPGPREPY